MQGKKTIDFKSSDFNFDAAKESGNNIVLFGGVGSGKTTLINKLCGMNFKTSKEGFSCTRLVQCSPTIRNNNLILDFPGLNSMREIIQHLTQQRETLKAIPVRMICFVVKYDNRYEQLLKPIIQMVRIFKHHLKNVGIIFTHSEQLNETTRSEIKAIVEEEIGITSKNIIFCTLQTPEAELSNQLNNIKEKMENIKETIIESSEIMKQFDSGVSLKFEETGQEYLDKFKLITRLHQEEFDKTSDKELKRCLYFSLKSHKDKLIEEFKDKLLNEHQLDIHQVVSQVILLQNTFYHDFKNFKALAERHLEIQSVVYNKEMNRYKKCIYCGLIWFRVYGCNSIVCGKRSVSKDKLFGKFLNYIQLALSVENLKFSKVRLIETKNIPIKKLLD
jgi:GTPase SAR1 family protein